MTVTPKDKTIAYLLSEEDVQFVVPKYQRNYVWPKEKWDALFDDLMENKGHFLGTLVLVEPGIGARGSLKPYEVIDGQQRITSISLLLIAIYDHLVSLYDGYVNKVPQDEIDHFISQKMDISKVLYIDARSKKDPRIMLSKINHNDVDYNYIVHSKLDKSCTLKPPKYFSSRQISHCYEHFKSKLNDMDLNDIYALEDNIFSAMTVAIYPDSEANAYLIFETLNNRGEPLSVVDIIKNKLFAKLDGNNNVLDEIDDEWRQNIESLNSDKENFFRHFYSANKFKYGDDIFKGDKRPQKASKSNIVEIYGDLITYDAEKLWDELKSQADVYSSLIEPKGSDKKDLIKSLLDLSYISAIPSYSLLLYLKNNQLSDSELTEVIKFLIVYFTRRHICDKPKVKDLDDIFINVIKNCQNKKLNSDMVIKTIMECSKGKVAGDTEFKNALNGDIYLTHRNALKFILVKIEESENHNLDESAHFWGKKENDRPNWTIEHILPKGGKKLSSSWKEALKIENDEKAVKERDSLTHRIGNLTLTGYNSKLSTKPFEEKKKNLNVALRINAEILNKDTWGRTEIEERTQTLVTKIIAANQLPSSSSNPDPDATCKEDQSNK